MAVLRERFDGPDRASVHPYRKLAARIGCFAIDEHGAGSALAAIATELGAGELQVVAQEFRQRRAVFDFDALRRAIDVDVNLSARDRREGGRIRRGRLAVQTGRCRSCNQRGAAAEKLAASQKITRFGAMLGLAHAASLRPPLQTIAADYP